MTSGAAAEHAIYHKDEVVPANRFKQFKNLEAQIKEAREEYNEIIERGIDPERQQNPATRASDIEEGRAIKEKLDVLEREKEALEANITKNQAPQNGSK